MRAIAKITEGQFLPLSNANLLAKVIVGAAIEEMSLQILMQDMEKEVKELRKEGNLQEEEIVKKVSEKMKSKKVETNQLMVDSLYSSPLDATNMDYLVDSKSLAENRSKLKPSSVSVAPTPAPMPSAMFGAPTSAVPYGGMPAPMPSSMFGAPSMGGMPAPMGGMPPSMPSAMFGAPTSAAPMASPMQTADYKRSEITDEQVSKMYSRAKKQNLL